MPNISQMVAFKHNRYKYKHSNNPLAMPTINNPSAMPTINKSLYHKEHTFSKPLTPLELRRHTT